MDYEKAKQPADSDGTSTGTPESYLSPDTHAFVVKIWLESLENEDDHTVWRGYITHVNSRQQRYFQDLSVILQFIQSCINTQRWGPKP